MIYLFHIDDDHDYENTTLATYSPEAKQKAENVTSIETVSDLEAYLEDQNAMDADDLRDLLS